MPDELIIINNLIQEHEAIKEHMQSVSTLAGDWKGMEWDNLTNLTHEQILLLNNKCSNLKHAVASLDEGLKQHWDHEDKGLPGLMGNKLMKSINIEHDEIKKQMNEVNFVISKSTPQEFLANREYLRHIVSYLSQLITEHEITENSILQLLKKQLI